MAMLNNQRVFERTERQSVRLSIERRPVGEKDMGSHHISVRYPLVICYSLLLKMAIEIVSFPIENGNFP